MARKQILRKSIFDLERRMDLLDEFREIRDDMANTKIAINKLKTETVLAALDESIKDWPYRAGASSIISFIEKRCYDKELKPFFTEEEIALYYLELYYNLLCWAPEHFESVSDAFDLRIGQRPISDSLRRFLENISYSLEQCNMRVREIEMTYFPQYIISKRDASVDSTLEVAPELSDVFLSYLDIRNQKDEKFKKNAIKSIADYLEPKEKSFKGTGYSSLCNDVFNAFNNLTIRHNNNRQKTVRKADRIKVYDALFRMSLHLIQKEQIDEDQLFVKSILNNTAD